MMVWSPLWAAPRPRSHVLRYRSYLPSASSFPVSKHARGVYQGLFTRFAPHFTSRDPASASLQEHLQEEMQEAVIRQGRVSLVELAALLNVDLFYCERASHFILEDPLNLNQDSALFGVQVRFCLWEFPLFY